MTFQAYKMKFLHFMPFQVFHDSNKPCLHKLSKDVLRLQTITGILNEQHPPQAGQAGQAGQAQASSYYTKAASNN